MLTVLFIMMGLITIGAVLSAIKALFGRNLLGYICIWESIARFCFVVLAAIGDTLLDD